MELPHCYFTMNSKIVALATTYFFVAVLQLQLPVISSAS